jgi:hypothetical protein
MKDYAREENGGLVVMASCSDERFPPENMLDGKDSTFWVTTGVFPQEFVLRLESNIRVSKITTLSLNGEGSGLFTSRGSVPPAAVALTSRVACSCTHDDRGRALSICSAETCGGEVRSGQAGGL